MPEEMPAQTATLRSRGCRWRESWYRYQCALRPFRRQPSAKARLAPPTPT